MNGSVVIEQHGGVLVATLSNPPHGLMDRAIVDGLAELVARTGDESVRGVVLTGAHPFGSSPTTMSGSYSPARGRARLCRHLPRGSRSGSRPRCATFRDPKQHLLGLRPRA